MCKNKLNEASDVMLCRAYIPVPVTVPVPVMVPVPVTVPPPVNVPVPEPEDEPPVAWKLHWGSLQHAPGFFTRAHTGGRSPYVGQLAYFKGTANQMCHTK